MLALQRSAVSSAASPLLTTATAAQGFLVDAAALSFSIWDVHDRSTAAVQVTASTPVDLDADRLGLGRYVAAWTVPSNAVFGRYQIRWSATIDTVDPTDGTTPYQRTLAWSEDFEVLANVEIVEHRFALVSDLRDEGVPAAILDWRILEALSNATTQLRSWLGWDVMPRYDTLRLDTRGSAIMPLRDAVLAIEELRMRSSDEVVSPTEIVIRDRRAPAIELRGGAPYELLEDLALRVGRATRTASANALLKGIFGVTEPDGSCLGRVPRSIRRAVTMLAQRDVTPLAQAQRRFDAKNGHRVNQFRTREQGITFDRRADNREMIAPFSGDPEIDGLLLPFVAPVGVSVP